ncbi:MAG: hypothetical protein ACLP0J_28730 [Solirubrobacteraceae bacterium]
MRGAPEALKAPRLRSGRPDAGERRQAQIRDVRYREEPGELGYGLRFWVL